MKSILTLTLSALMACTVIANAQSTNAPPPGDEAQAQGGGPGGGRHHGPDFSFLTEAQKAELKKDRDAALAANPSLATQEQTLHDQMKQDRESKTKPTADQMKQFKDLQDQIDAAMIKIDPSVADIIKEIKAHHPRKGPPGGGAGGDAGGPPPPDGGN